MNKLQEALLFVGSDLKTAELFKANNVCISAKHLRTIIDALNETERKYADLFEQNELLNPALSVGIAPEEHY